MRVWETPTTASTDLNLTVYKIPKKDYSEIIRKNIKRWQIKKQFLQSLRYKKTN